jgi:hypothetical protein
MRAIFAAIIGVGLVWSSGALYLALKHNPQHEFILDNGQWNWVNTSQMFVVNFLVVCTVAAVLAFTPVAIKHVLIWIARLFAVRAQR